MATTQHSCSGCGRTLDQGSLFCRYCGQPQPAQVPVKRRRRPSIILIIAGALVFLFGLRIPAAQFLGQTTTGTITGVSQEISSSSDHMDYNYTIQYSFNTGHEKLQSGSYMLMRVYDYSKLPDEGTLIKVRYLPGLTFINFAEGQENIGLSTLLILAAGLAVIVLGISGAGRLGVRR